MRQILPCCWASAAEGSNRLSRSRAAGAHSSLASKPHTDNVAKDALTLGRNGDCARAPNALYPACLEAARTQCRSERTSQVRSPFAPIEAGPAKDAGGPAPTR